MPEVSVIIAAYNAEETIQRALRSLIEQDLEDWEAIVVDDGSTDTTTDKVRSIQDERIELLSIEHGGVSSARNAGLKRMRGSFFCFLDADDVLPPKSLSSRKIFFDNDPGVQFVDGRVVQIDERTEEQLSVYTPSFKGKVIDELLRFRSTCFVGNTWMIRRRQGIDYQFDPKITHAEDLAFYLSIAGEGSYDHTTEDILIYRRNPSSAMTDIRGMEKGLLRFMKAARSHPKSSFSSRMEMKYRITRAISGSYFHTGQYGNALTSFLRTLIA